MKIQTIAFILLWAFDESPAIQNESLTFPKGFEGRNELAVSLHSRRKRYIVFPKGSSLQLLLEVLVHVPTSFRVVIGPTLQVSWPLPSDFRSKKSPENFFSSPMGGSKYKIYNDVATLMVLFGTTVGLAWQLPDDPMIYQEFKKKHRIYKRSVFKKMEAFMRPGGVNGRQCVLKALCESGQRTPSKKDFLMEVLHKIFSVDREEEFEEHPDDKIYWKAHQSINQNCETLYPECQFSLFNEVH